MDEQDGRLRLLESELTANDGCIRSYDTTSFKVKGWCVTVTRAVAGFAASGHKSLLVIGVVAVVGFWLLDAQIRAIQQEFINRNKRIRESIRSQGLAAVLDGEGGIHILGVPDVFREHEAPCPTRGLLHG